MSKKSLVIRFLDPYTHVEKALREYQKTIPQGQTFLNVLDSGVFINVTDFQRAAIGKCLEIVSDLRRFHRTEKRHR